MIEKDEERGQQVEERSRTSVDEGGTRDDREETGDNGEHVQPHALVAVAEQRLTEQWGKR